MDEQKGIFERIDALLATPGAGHSQSYNIHRHNDPSNRVGWRVTLYGAIKEFDAEDLNAVLESVETYLKANVDAEAKRIEESQGSEAKEETAL